MDRHATGPLLITHLISLADLRDERRDQQCADARDDDDRGEEDGRRGGAASLHPVALQPLHRPVQRKREEQ